MRQSYGEYYYENKRRPVIEFGGKVLKYTGLGISVIGLALISEGAIDYSIDTFQSNISINTSHQNSDTDEYIDEALIGGGLLLGGAVLTVAGLSIESLSTGRRRHTR
jgi:hypothetical protein